MSRTFGYTRTFSTSAGSPMAAQQRQLLEGYAQQHGFALDQVEVLVLEFLRAFKSSRRSEEVRAALRARKCQGLRWTRCPGYGYRWAGPRGKQRRVPDEAEQAALAKIVQLRECGLSWYGIARDLLLAGVKTAAGREWSPSRVRRGYAAVRTRSAGPLWADKNSGRHT